jgi:predicted DNA-binding transcriptional regulator YafY
MRRADRLFRLLQRLRSGQVVTAAQLAAELTVTPRTVYRDVRDLMRSGVPIEGEAGVGYALRHFDLPPLMFGAEEIEALVLGARVVQSWSDAALAGAAHSALAKVEVVLPRRLKRRIAETSLFAPDFHVPRRMLAGLAELRGALIERRKVHFAYTRPDEVRTQRTIRPLALFFWGSTWSVTGWCELRNDFRSFRLDRVEHLQVLPERFEAEPGRTLEDYFRHLDEEHPQPRAAQSSQRTGKLQPHTHRSSGSHAPARRRRAGELAGNRVARIATGKS